MGFSPQEVDQASLWKLNAAWAGYLEAHGGEVDTGLSANEFDDISSWLDNV